MESCETYWAKIFLGLREGYGGPEHDLSEVRTFLKTYVDNVGLCVTLTPTEFVYTRGDEPGCVVGLINYPRFPRSEEETRREALRIASLLKDLTGQNRVSVMFPNQTVMLEQEAGIV